MAVVMSGTAIAQLISFALTPVISRFFNPSDFGIFGSFIAVLGVISAGVTLQYSQAVMLPKEDSDAANIFAVSIISVLFITVIGIIEVCLFPVSLLSLFKAPDRYWLLWFFPFGIFLGGMNQSFQAWCIRRKAFAITSISQVVRAISANISQIGLGFFRAGGAGLAAGAVFGDGLANVNLTYLVFKKDWLQIRQSVGWHKMKEMAYEYRDFPIYSSTQNVLNALSQGLPVLLLGHYYGVAIAGAYAFGVRILSVPMSFVLVALRQVLFQKANETYNYGGKLYPLYLKITGGLFAISIIPSIILFIWAPSIFAFIFGSKWFEAGIYARWLILWLMVGFCNLPSNLFARILRQQRNLFFYELVILLSRVSVLIAGGILLSAKGTVILFSVVGCLLNVFFIFWIGCILRKNHVVIDTSKEKGIFQI
ncbi:MAG: oligosaccharide flippase family protein [Candidatus Helarchaeota archaeon]|nr:oligosaccharide flippase family protein [Candidatus Helarchaeota archaeon]